MSTLNAGTRAPRISAIDGRQLSPPRATPSMRIFTRLSSVISFAPVDTTVYQMIEVMV